MYKFTCEATVVMCLLLITPLWSQISPQAGFPIVFEEINTFRPIVTEDINPNYPGKEIILFAGGPASGPGHSSPYRL